MNSINKKMEDIKIKTEDVVKLDITYRLPNCELGHMTFLPETWGRSIELEFWATFEVTDSLPDNNNNEPETSTTSESESEEDIEPEEKPAKESDDESESPRSSESKSEEEDIEPE